MALAFSRYASSLRQNATITPQHPKQSHQTYNPPPRSKTLDCFFAKPAPEVVAAANSLAVVSAPARNFNSGHATTRTRDRSASTTSSFGTSRRSC